MRKFDTKLIFAWLIVLVVLFGNVAGASDPDSDKVRIASWNIRIFSDNSRDDSELERICDVLISYDFIAIVELRDETVLQRAETMLEAMGRDYDYEISGKVGRGVKELYAFMFAVDKVDVVTPGQIFPDPEDVFIREPYFASFRAGQFDFTVIAVHVIWGDRVGDRRAEIQALADVYDSVQRSDSSEQDVILVGDFNREPDDDKAYGKLRDIDSMTNVFQLPHKSHVQDSSLYDNMWFQSDYLSEYTGTSGIDKFDETDFANDDDSAKLAVSDHRPVWAEFSISKDDDGLEVTDMSESRPDIATTWAEIRALRETVSNLEKQVADLNKRLLAVEQATSKDSSVPSFSTNKEPARAQPIDDDTIVYITSTGGKYHKAGCSYLRKKAIPIKKSEAIKRGKTPCSRCNP